MTVQLKVTNWRAVEALKDFLKVLKEPSERCVVTTYSCMCLTQKPQTNPLSKMSNLSCLTRIGDEQLLE